MAIDIDAPTGGAKGAPTGSPRQAAIERKSMSRSLNRPKRRASCLVALALSGPAFAQPVGVAPWMTGKYLLELQTLPVGVASESGLTLQQYLDRRSAQLYLHGVHDATEGKEWCYDKRSKPKPDVIEDVALDALRALPPEQLGRNAADLIVEAWRNRWPCGGKP